MRSLTTTPAAIVGGGTDTDPLHDGRCPQIRWTPATTAVLPSRSEAHVWAASLRVDRARGLELSRTLAPDERARAARFHTSKLRHAFVAGRGLLREILGAYLGIPAAVIRFSYGAHGKPALSPAMPSVGVQFNVAHSDDLIVLAVTGSETVGVDVEAVVPLPDLANIAGSFFSLAERRALARVPAGDAVAAFYRAWTRKEAYLKANGMGLLAPLDGFDVSLGADDPPALLRVDGQPGEARRWSLAHLEPADGFVGALAVPMAQPDVRCWSWRS